MALSFIVGWPLKEKDIGVVSPGYCDHCRNSSAWHLLKTRRWGTFFFIPFLPLGSKNWYLMCDICGAGLELEKHHVGYAKEMVEHTQAYSDGQMSEEDYFVKVDQFTTALKSFDSETLEELEDIETDEIEEEQDIRGFQ